MGRLVLSFAATPVRESGGILAAPHGRSPGDHSVTLAVLIPCSGPVVPCLVAQPAWCQAEMGLGGRLHGPADLGPGADRSTKVRECSLRSSLTIWRKY